MIQIVKPAQAFYDDGLPQMLVLLSYRTEAEFSNLFGMSTAVYGIYTQGESHKEMLAAMTQSSYQQVHMTVDKVMVIDKQFNPEKYFIIEDDVSSIVSIPAVSDTFELSDRALLVKSDRPVVLANTKPLLMYAMPAPYLAESVSKPDEDNLALFAQNRIIVFVMIITILALIIAIVFFVLKKKRKTDISSYY